jgi:hypothetical protein
LALWKKRDVHFVRQQTDNQIILALVIVHISLRPKRSDRFSG